MLQKLAKLLPLLALAAAAPTSLTIHDESPGGHHDNIKVGGVLPAALMSDVQAMFDFFGIPGGVISVVSPEEGVNGVEVIGIKDKEGSKMDADVSHEITYTSGLTRLTVVDLSQHRLQFQVHHCHRSCRYGGVWQLHVA